MGTLDTSVWGGVGGDRVFVRLAYFVMGYCYLRIPALVCFSLCLFILVCRVLFLFLLFLVGHYLFFLFCCFQSLGVPSIRICLCLECLGSVCVMPCLRFEDHF